MLFALLSSLSSAISIVVDKSALDRAKVNHVRYLTTTLLLIALIMLPFTIFLWDAHNIFTLKVGFLLVALAGLGAIANLLYYHAIEHHKLSSFEPYLLLTPLFGVIAAVTFLPLERNPILVLAAIIAGVTIVLFNMQKHHIVITKGVMLMIGSAFFGGLAVVPTKLLLDNFSPFSLYFIRISFMFLIVFLFFKAHKKQVLFSPKPQVILAQVLIIFAFVFAYFAYTIIGVVHTILLLSLQPIIVLSLSALFLKEHVKRKDIYMSIIILGIVIITELAI